MLSKREFIKLKKEFPMDILLKYLKDNRNKAFSLKELHKIGGCKTARSTSIVLGRLEKRGLIEKRQNYFSINKNV